MSLENNPRTCRAASAVLLSAIVGVAGCGGSGTDDAAGNTDGMAPPATNGSAYRQWAIDALEVTDALFFIIDDLYDELQRTATGPSSVGQSSLCDNADAVQIDTDGDSRTYRFDGCQWLAEPGVSLEGSVTLTAAPADSTTIALSELRIRGEQIDIALEGGLTRQALGARVDAQGDPWMQVRRPDEGEGRMVLDPVSMELDRTRLVALNALNFSADVERDGQRTTVQVSGSASGSSPGCPVDGEWQVSVEQALSLSILGAEGGNLLIDRQGATETLACSELALLKLPGTDQPPPPPVN